MRTRPEAQQHEDGDRESEEGRAVLLDVVERGGVEVGAQRDAAVEEPERGEDADHVSLVERVDPVALTQVVAATGLAELASVALSAPRRRTQRALLGVRSRARDHALGSTPPAATQRATTSSASRGL